MHSDSLRGWLKRSSQLLSLNLVVSTTRVSPPTKSADSGHPSRTALRSPGALNHLESVSKHDSRRTDWEAVVQWRSAGARSRSFRIDAPSLSGSSSGLMPQKHVDDVLSDIAKSTCTLTRSAPSMRVNSLTGVGSACQTPEKSTFPLMRGAGAVKSGLQSWLRGVGRRDGSATARRQKPGERVQRQGAPDPVPIRRVGCRRYNNNRDEPTTT